jgi:hypothetical protein
MALIQMMPYNTNHGLKTGYFMHGKHCTKCKKSIGELFEVSKQNAVFYYCPVDYNLIELEDMNTDIAAN